jgi:hypothetical protein
MAKEGTPLWAGFVHYSIGCAIIAAGMDDIKKAIGLWSHFVFACFRVQSASSMIW